MNCDCAVVVASHNHSKAIFDKLGMEQIASYPWKDKMYNGKPYFDSVVETEAMTAHIKMFK